MSSSEEIKKMLVQYQESRKELENITRLLDNKRNEAGALRGSIEGMLTSTFSLADTIKSIDANVRPRLVELSDCDQQLENSYCMLVLQGAPHIGILLQGNGSSMPTENSEIEMISFEITSGIRSGKFILCPISTNQDHLGIKAAQDKAVAGGIEYLLDLSGDNLFSLASSVFIQESINVERMLPWIRVH
ncbi:MAG: hypothetical protein WC823_05005 [Parcubacteria group bacterium]|jgi:hypothetical protein